MVSGPSPPFTPSYQALQLSLILDPPFQFPTQPLTPIDETLFDVIPSIHKAIRNRNFNELEQVYSHRSETGEYHPFIDHLIHPSNENQTNLILLFENIDRTHVKLLFDECLAYIRYLAIEELQQPRLLCVLNSVRKRLLQNSHTHINITYRRFVLQLKLASDFCFNILISSEWLKIVAAEGWPTLLFELGEWHLLKQETTAVMTTIGQYLENPYRTSLVVEIMHRWLDTQQFHHLNQFIYIFYKLLSPPSMLSRGFVITQIPEIFPESILSHPNFPGMIEDPKYIKKILKLYPYSVALPLAHLDPNSEKGVFASITYFDPIDTWTLAFAENFSWFSLAKLSTDVRAQFLKALLAHPKGEYLLSPIFLTCSNEQFKDIYDHINRDTIKALTRLWMEQLASDPEAILEFLRKRLLPHLNEECPPKITFDHADILLTTAWSICCHQNADRVDRMIQHHRLQVVALLMSHVKHQDWTKYVQGSEIHSHLLKTHLWLVMCQSDKERMLFLSDVLSHPEGPSMLQNTVRHWINTPVSKKVPYLKRITLSHKLQQAQPRLTRHDRDLTTFFHVCHNMFRKHTTLIEPAFLTCEDSISLPLSRILKLSTAIFSFSMELFQNSEFFAQARTVGKPILGILRPYYAEHVSQPKQKNPITALLQRVSPVSPLDAWHFTLSSPEEAVATHYFNLTSQQKARMLHALQKEKEWQTVAYPISTAAECDAKEFECLFENLSLQQQSSLIAWQTQGIPEASIDFRSREEEPWDYLRASHFFSRQAVFIQNPKITALIIKQLMSYQLDAVFHFFKRICIYPSTLTSHFYLQEFVRELMQVRFREKTYSYLRDEVLRTRGLSNRGLSFPEYLLITPSLNKLILNLIATNDPVFLSKYFDHLTCRLLETRLSQKNRSSILKFIQDNFINNLSNEEQRKHFSHELLKFTDVVTFYLTSNVVQRRMFVVNSTDVDQIFQPLFYRLIRQLEESRKESEEEEKSILHDFLITILRDDLHTLLQRLFNFDNSLQECHLSQIFINHVLLEPIYTHAQPMIFDKVLTCFFYEDPTYLKLRYFFHHLPESLQTVLKANSPLVTDPKAFFPLLMRRIAERQDDIHLFRNMFQANSTSDHVLRVILEANPHYAYLFEVETKRKHEAKKA
ncbi:MAG: hypothetical protein H0X51_07170 [Parachlamydiaceae bacterium]|nr:hypothetical protein [Parachlamydiaceae bacterium]